MRKIILFSAVGLAAFWTLVWVGTAFLGVHGSRLLALRIALMALGAIAAGAIAWFVSKQQDDVPANTNTPATGQDDIAPLFREAERKLAAARLPKGTRIGNLPAILLLGEPGSVKTSALSNCGIEAELLAGHLYQDGKVAPTRMANVWFSRGTIFAEAGGALLGAVGVWKSFLRQLQPRRLAAAVGNRMQAPRAALVCVDIEQVIAGGDPLAALGRNLRARLGDAAETFGIQLPVYVLFTKADRVPFFAEFVRNLSTEESTQVLGVTLPLRQDTDAGIYVEQQREVLNHKFEELFRSLCDARPEFLSRENDATQLPGAYEFPREFRKLRTPLLQLLIDLCRPSQLTVGPFLRGFYFSGIRPVVISESIPVSNPSVAQIGQQPDAGATRMFRPGASNPAPAQPVPVTRRVPQWLFLGRLFSNVLLGDQAVASASGSSAKTSLLRRGLLASFAVVCLILCIGFTVSFFRNRALEQQINDAVHGSAAAVTPGGLASVEALRRLDILRKALETLTIYHREGAPLSYRWGLYAGNRLYPQVRRIYFGHFRQQIFGETQERLLQSLRNLPVSPGPAYGETYSNLKAYLITTSHHEKSTSEFLAPVLLNTWSTNRNVDPERLQLAQRQFTFYSGELKAENPFSEEADGAAVEKARRYLSQFAGFERVYQAMLTDAAKTSAPINFNRKFPGSAEVVVDAAEITGPFTKAGWDFMSKAMQSPDRYFNGEQWVLGDQSAAANLDYSKLAQQLRQRYQADFVAQWLAYLKRASVVRYANLKDAAHKLNLLSGNQSPLLALFWLASQNTSIGDPQIASVFQPVQAVVPPGSVDRYVAAPNQNYMNSLVALQTTLDALSNQPEGNDAAAQQTLTSASAASVAARQLAQGFRLDPQTHVDTIVQKLLEDPITYAEALLRNLGPAELNGKGKAFCTQFRQLTTKYPFSANATTDATLDDVNNIFGKPNGALWAFYQSSLQKLLTKQGNQYTPIPGGSVALTPAFVNFFNHAAALSDSLYANGSPDPRIAYSLKPIATEGIGNLGLQIDGQTLSYSGGPATAQNFFWQGSGAHGAKATVQFGSGPDLTWSSNEGLWAVFHFFGKADHRQPTPNGELLEWTIRIGKEAVTLPGNKPLTVRLELIMPAGSFPVFERGIFSRLSCVSQVAR